jgi:hypothetical protein
MDLNRLRQGEKIAAAAAIVLLVLMFLPWFGIDEDSVISQAEDFQSGASTEELLEAQGDIEETFGDVDDDATSVDLNAWESFGLIDIILLLTILVTLGLVAARASGRDLDLPVSAGTLIAALGILSTLLILYRLIDTPGVSFLEYDRQFGVFLGLIAAAGIAFGGWRAMQEEGTSFSREADRLQDRTGDDSPPPPPPPPAAPPPTTGTGTGTGPGAPPGGPTV